MAGEKYDSTKHYGFPSEFVSPKKKKEPKYGLQIARAIDSRHKITSTYFSADRFQRYITNRKYAEGLQSIDKFKDLMDVEGDTSYLNLDWSALPIIPKYVDILVGEMTNQDYKILCTAIDPISKTTKDKDREKMLANMRVKAFSEEIKGITGMSILPEEEYTPSNKEEMDLHMSLNYKQAHEIAMEEAQDFVFSNNKWSEVSKRVIRDLIVLKKAGIRSYFDENNNIRYRYVDPVATLTSFTDQPDHEGLKYAGEIIYMPLHELHRRTKGKFTNEQLFDIARRSEGGKNPKWEWGSSWDGYYSQYGADADLRHFNNYLIPVFDFEYHTIDTKKYEERYSNFGDDKFWFEEKDFNYKYDKNSGARDREIHTKELDMVYTGLWIIGTDHICDWGLAKFMPREKKNGNYSPNTQTGFIIYAPDIYDMENRSHVERMIPHADQIQLCHLKMQHLLGKIAPPGIAWDVSALNDVILGKGDEAATPLELQELYQQTGVAYYNGEVEEGVPRNRPPVEAIQNAVGSQLQEVIAVYNYNLEMIRQVTGLNEARDASTPDKDALPGVQKLMLLSSRNATRTINNAYKNIYERLAKRISLMVLDSVHFGNGIEGFVDAIGQRNVDILSQGDVISSWEFGVKIEAMMDEEGRAQVEADIQIGLANDTLKHEDALQIRNIPNLKLATQYLILKRKSYTEEKAKEKMMEAELNRQNILAAAEAELHKEKGKSDIKIQEEKEILALKEQYEITKHERKKEELILQGQIKNMNIEKAGDEKFKDTALSKSVPQEKVFSNPSKSA